MDRSAHVVMGRRTATCGQVYARLQSRAEDPAIVARLQEGMSSPTFVRLRQQVQQPNYQYALQAGLYGYVRVCGSMKALFQLKRRPPPDTLLDTINVTGAPTSTSKCRTECRIPRTSPIYRPDCTGRRCARARRRTPC